MVTCRCVAQSAKETVEVFGQLEVAVAKSAGVDAATLLEEDDVPCPGLPDADADLKRMEVVIKDADGTTVAVDRVPDGNFTIGPNDEWFCELTFDANVDDSEFYEILVGDDRGSETVSRGELRASGDAVTSRWCY